MVIVFHYCRRSRDCRNEALLCHQYAYSNPPRYDGAIREATHAAGHACNMINVSSSLLTVPLGKLADHVCSTPVHALGLGLESHKRDSPDYDRTSI